VASAASAGSTTTTASTTSFIRTTPTPGVREINYPPYVINNVQGDLAGHAVSPNATHHGKLQAHFLQHHPTLIHCSL
jgi:alpha-glucosidase